MASIETVAAAQWLYSTLTGDSTLMALISGVYQDVAPTAATLPYVVIAGAVGDDLMAIGGSPTHRVWSPQLWVVKVVSAGASYGGNLATAAARIDTLLHGKSGSVSNGEVVAAYRIRSFQMAETGPGGEQYRHLGGVYRLLVR